MTVVQDPSIPYPPPKPLCERCGGTGAVNYKVCVCRVPTGYQGKHMAGTDPVNPDYYDKAGTSAIHIMEALGKSVIYAQGNVLKYVLRYQDKNGIEDLRKAMWYLAFLVGKEEGLEGNDVVEYAVKKSKLL